jgi:hypothetical protein
MRLQTHMTTLVCLATVLTGCATSRVSYRKTSNVPQKTKKVAEQISIPAPSDNYELSGSDWDAGDEVRRRGNKARGTNEY